MRRLLSANLVRMWKSKIFWVLEIISAIAGIVMSGLAVYNTKKIGDSWFLVNGNYYFWLELIYIGVVVALFISFFVGTEYENGTIRNKLSVGHCRRDIYLMNYLIGNIAGLLFTVTHITVSLLVGFPFLGALLWESLAAVSWRIIGTVAIILCYAAIFTFLAMLDNSKARNGAISLVLSLVIALGGLYTYGRLQEPEFTSKMVMQEDGSFLREEGVPNSRYLSGTARDVYTVADALLPSAQALRIANSEGEFSTLSLICLAGVAIAFTSGGVVAFKKKDIR